MTQSREIPNGYVINLFQYARRYRYNSNGMLTYFNHLIDQPEYAQTSDPDYLCFGDFDCIEVIPVDTFQKFHDVSPRAKDWLGKRQSVLLYNIRDDQCPTRIFYNKGNHEKSGKWLQTNTSNSPEHSNFFCLSMLSLTNEIVCSCEQSNISQDTLIREVRRKILKIVDCIQASDECGHLSCEVFGSFNSSEVAIIWLSEQYTDVLQVIDYVKHTHNKINDQVNKIPVFLNSFSVIAQDSIAQRKFLNKAIEVDRKAKALIQIAIHDVITCYDELKTFVENLIPNESKSESRIYYSVGEYDVVIELPAKDVFCLFQPKGALSIGAREHIGEKYFYKLEYRKILRNNTRLVYAYDDDDFLQQKLQKLFKDGLFCLHLCLNENSSDMPDFEHFELIGNSSSIQDQQELSNHSLYDMVRDKLKDISPSSGMIDILDLLYTDYRSAVGTAYSAMWVSDLHRQFKAILNVILELLEIHNDSEENNAGLTTLPWSWDDYLQLHNVFKQQIFHLTQSNRMFFETPSCHLRSTGHFDYLMHAYYGITKKILNLIYLLQRNGKQSELVPFITVNIVPQVKTQLFYENLVDSMRVIDIDIPQAIIFNPYRGINYLVHELFHHAAPKDRSKRNQLAGKLLLSSILCKQFIEVFEDMIEIEQYVDSLDAHNTLRRVLYYSGNDVAPSLKDLNQQIISYVQDNYEKIEKEIYSVSASDSDRLFSSYQRDLLDYTQSNKSNDFFYSLFEQLLENIWMRSKTFTSTDTFNANDPALSQALPKIIAYVQFYRQNKESLKDFIRHCQFFRRISKEYSDDTFASDTVWNSLREACCDVAMVTMTGMSRVDYLLFCIQAWTDVYRDRKGNLYTADQYQESVLRTNMVLMYNITCNRWGNIHPSYRNEEVTYIILTSSEKKEFICRYIAFYYYPNQAGKSKEEHFAELKLEAEEWIARYEECYLDFSTGHAYSFDLMVPILKDFDVDSRIKNIAENKIRDEACQIKDEFAHYMQQYSQYLSSISFPYDTFTEQVHELIRDYRKESFQHDFALVCYFQKQLSLRALGEINRETKSAVTAVKKDEIGTILHAKPFKIQTKTSVEDEWKFRVYNLEQLQFYLRHCVKKLSKNDIQGPSIPTMPKNLSSIWYRGQASEEYLLLPTIVRKFQEPAYKNTFPTLRSFQEHLYSEFKFRADGALEATADGEYTVSDYIALMQHYQETSNYLDWSDSAFRALYFALHKTIEGLRNGQVPKSNKSATITLFNPIIYNRQRNAVISGGSSTPPSFWTSKEFFQKIYHNEHGHCYKMPNLTVREDENSYDAFLLGNRDFDVFFTGNTSMSQEYHNCADLDSIGRELFLPLAIWTSRWNPRIRAQSGSFVAFNLYTPPMATLPCSNVSNIPSEFRYMSLDYVQERFKNYFPGEMFMYQIILDKDCCEEVARWLTESMGMSNFDVYPDLSKLKERFLNQ